jgi:hypothetical protein
VDQIADFTATSRETVARVYRKVNPESLRDMAESLAMGLRPIGAHGVRTKTPKEAENGSYPQLGPRRKPQFS